MSDLRIRTAVRALVFDDEDRILLVRFEPPGRTVWIALGGGVDEGETDEEAIRREVLEEAGLEGFELGPLVWTRTHIAPLDGGRWDGQSERYYLVRTSAFEPSPGLGWEGLRLEGATDVRWWTLTELGAGGAEFAPRRLPELVHDLLQGAPAEPVDVGV